jgi:hypothetical protein
LEGLSNPDEEKGGISDLRLSLRSILRMMSKNPDGFFFSSMSYDISDREGRHKPTFEIREVHQHLEEEKRGICHASNASIILTILYIFKNNSNS